MDSCDYLRVFITESSSIQHFGQTTVAQTYRVATEEFMLQYDQKVTLSASRAGE